MSPLPSSSLPKCVRIVDVGPRDGLQNEQAVVPTDVKVALIERLADAGVRNVESTSFVSPKWVPQMADAADVMARIRRKAGVVYSVLVPNMKGFEGALAARADEAVVFGAASEAFSQKNINCSIAESIERFRPVVARRARGRHARARRHLVRARLPVPGRGRARGRRATSRALMRDMGCTNSASPTRSASARRRQVQRAMEAALAVYPVADVSGHFHDTYGQALANVYACLELGIATFDTSVTGLGGCPYAKGATGNVATEDVVYMLHGLGIDTGVDLAKLREAGRFISAHLGRATGSRAGRALDVREGVVA